MDIQKPQKTRNITLDAVKGLAIILVMLGHVISLNGLADPIVYDMIKAVQMPLFMVVSGYLGAIGHHVSGLKDYGRTVGKRAVSYLVPFFVWIVLIYMEELPGAIVDTLFHLDYGLWFLMTLFILTLMVLTAQLFASFIPKEKKIGRACMFWIVYAILAAVVLAETLLGITFLSPELTRLYIPFYMCGYIAGEYLRPVVEETFTDGVKNQNIRMAKCIGAAVCFVIFIALTILFDLTAMGTMKELLVQLIASFTGVAWILFLVSRLRAGRIKWFLAWVGGFTLEIYALHFRFATILEEFLRAGQYPLYTLQGVGYVLIAFAIMTVITATIIWLTKKWWVLDLLLYGKRRK